MDYRDVYEDVFVYLVKENSVNQEVYNNVSEGGDIAGLDRLDNFIVLINPSEYPFDRADYNDFYVAASQNLKKNKIYWLWILKQPALVANWWLSTNGTMWEKRCQLIPQLTYTSEYIIVERSIELPYYNKSINRTNSLLEYNTFYTPFSRVEDVELAACLNIDGEILSVDSTLTSKNIVSDSDGIYKPYTIYLKPYLVGFKWDGPEDLEDVLIENTTNFWLIVSMLPQEQFFESLI